jgi:hypothetical protein
MQPTPVLFSGHRATSIMIIKSLLLGWEAKEQTVRFTVFMAPKAQACATNEQLKMAFGLDFFDYFFYQEKK